MSFVHLFYLSDRKVELFQADSWSAREHIRYKQSTVNSGDVCTLGNGPLSSDWPTERHPVKECEEVIRPRYYYAPKWIAIFVDSGSSRRIRSIHRFPRITQGVTYPISFFSHSVAANTAKLLDYSLSKFESSGIILWNVSLILHSYQPRIRRFFLEITYRALKLTLLNEDYANRYFKCGILCPPAKNMQRTLYLNTMNESRSSASPYTYNNLLVAI